MHSWYYTLAEPNICLPSYIANWIGPLDKHWNSDQCPFIGEYLGYSLDECKKKCLETERCTAINHNHVLNNWFNCELRGCPQPVPHPTSTSLVFPNYKGRYYATGIILEY